MSEKGTYAAVAVKISVLDVPGSVRLIRPMAKIAVNSAMKPRSMAVVCTVESTDIATVGRRQATTVATKEVKRNMLFIEYVSRVGCTGVS